MKLHFIHDFETLGQNKQTCIVLDCSIGIFDWERFTSNEPYTPEELLNTCIHRFKFDVLDQKKNYGYKAEQQTIEWWSQQSVEAQRRCLPSSEDRPLAEFSVWLLEHLSGKKIQKWWARGSDFDPIILRRILTDLNCTEVENILKFWNLRDTRSFIDGFTMFGHDNSFVPMEDESEWERIFIKHSSPHDIMADILRLQTLARLKEGLDI